MIRFGRTTGRIMLDLSPIGVLTKGDFEGHPFRGNQYTGGLATGVAERPSFRGTDVSDMAVSASRTTDNTNYARYPNASVVDARIQPIVRQQEDAIRGEQDETGVIISPAGQVLATVTSHMHDGISLSQDARASMQDAVFTHNHPDGYAISLRDIQTAARYNAAEMRAVTSDGTFRLARTGSQWPSGWAARVERIDSELYDEWARRIYQGSLRIEDANAMHQTEVLNRAVREEPSVVFTFEPRA
jgi:hypothetical protein